jgi:hypothetical protein
VLVAYWLLTKQFIRGLSAGALQGVAALIAYRNTITVAWYRWSGVRSAVRGCGAYGIGAKAVAGPWCRDIDFGTGCETARDARGDITSDDGDASRKVPI